MPRKEKVRLALIGLEVALWTLAAAYVAFGGQWWWQFSSAGAGASAVRALRKRNYARPLPDQQEPHRQSPV